MVVALALLIGASLGWALRWSQVPEPALSGTLRHASVRVDGRERSFAYYLPPRLREPAPLVLVLHGSSMSGAMMRRATGYDFERLADAEGFVAVYPQGFKGHWNDCRVRGDYAAKRLGIDDVAFVRALIDWFVKTHGIHRDQVFAAGLSNGGHLSYRLALEAPDLVRGIAAIAASLPTEANQSCRPAGKPLPVMIINGTEDPLNPFEGGEVALYGLFMKRGSVLSTAESAGYWAGLGKPSGGARREPIPDRNPRDGTTARRLFWPGSASEVVLISVEGGGHTSPHPAVRFPRLLGRTSHDFSAAEEIWRFFDRQLATAPASPTAPAALPHTRTLPSSSHGFQ